MLQYKVEDDYYNEGHALIYLIKYWKY